MNNNQLFGVMWFLGAVITYFAVLGAGIIEAAMDYVWGALLMLAGWPIFLGLTIGEIWSIVQ